MGRADGLICGQVRVGMSSFFPTCRWRCQHGWWADNGSGGDGQKKWWNQSAYRDGLIIVVVKVFIWCWRWRQLFPHWGLSNILAITTRFDETVTTQIWRWRNSSVQQITFPFHYQKYNRSTSASLAIFAAVSFPSHFFIALTTAHLISLVFIVALIHCSNKECIIHMTIHLANF